MKSLCANTGQRCPAATLSLSSPEGWLSPNCSPFLGPSQGDTAAQSLVSCNDTQGHKALSFWQATQAGLAWCSDSGRRWFVSLSTYVRAPGLGEEDDMSSVLQKGLQRPGPELLLPPPTLLQSQRPSESPSGDSKDRRALGLEEVLPFYYSAMLPHCCL